MCKLFNSCQSVVPSVGLCVLSAYSILLYMSLDLVSHHAVRVKFNNTKDVFSSDVFLTALSGRLRLARAPAQH